MAKFFKMQQAEHDVQQRLELARLRPSSCERKRSGGAFGTAAFLLNGVDCGTGTPLYRLRRQ